MQIFFPQIAPTIQILFGIYVAYIFIDKVKFYEKLIEKIWDSFRVQNKIISQAQKDLEAIFTSFQEFKDDEWALNSQIGSNGNSFIEFVEAEIAKLKSHLNEFTKTYNENKGNLYSSKTFSYISLNQAIYCFVILVITSIETPIDPNLSQFLLIFACSTSLYLYLCWAYECTITTSQCSIFKILKSFYYTLPRYIKLLFNKKWCQSKQGEQIAITILPITLAITLITIVITNWLNATPKYSIISINFLYWWVLLIPIINIVFYILESKRRAGAHKETFKIEFNESIRKIQELISQLNITITTAKTSAILQLRVI